MGQKEEKKEIIKFNSKIFILSYFYPFGKQIV